MLAPNPSPSMRLPFRLPDRRLIAFVLVGTAAAAVHFAVVVALVSGAGLPPLQANVAGWGVAFLVSYGGHRWQTFRDSDAPTGQTLPRFFLISAAGFLVNELAYAWLLQHAGGHYRAALAVVLVGVAALTYLTSRGWAFRHRVR
jgi:putative flippase GtrA